MRRARRKGEGRGGGGGGVGGGGEEGGGEGGGGGGGEAYVDGSGRERRAEEFPRVGAPSRSPPARVEIEIEVEVEVERPWWVRWYVWPSRRRVSVWGARGRPPASCARCMAVVACTAL